MEQYTSDQGVAELFLLCLALSNSGKATLYDIAPRGRLTTNQPAKA